MDAKWKKLQDNFRQGPEEMADGKDNETERIERFGYIQKNYYLIQTVSARQLLVQLSQLIRSWKIVGLLA